MMRMAICRPMEPFAPMIAISMSPSRCPMLAIRARRQRAHRLYDTPRDGYRQTCRCPVRRDRLSRRLIEQPTNARRDLGGLEKHHAEIDGLPRRYRKNTIVAGLNEQHRAMFTLDHDAL